MASTRGVHAARVENSLVRLPTAASASHLLPRPPRRAGGIWQQQPVLHTPRGSQSVERLRQSRCMTTLQRSCMVTPQVHDRTARAFAPAFHVPLSSSSCATASSSGFAHTATQSWSHLSTPPPPNASSDRQHLATLTNNDFFGETSLLSSVQQVTLRSRDQCMGSGKGGGREGLHGRIGSLG